MLKNNVFIIGAGFVGKMIHDELVKHQENLPFNSVLIQGRINRPSDAEELIAHHAKAYGEPFAIINAMGKTGTPNVDWCEDHKEETFFGNVELPLMLAEVAWKRRLPLIHISSGCIFNGTGPFMVDAVPNFDGSFYSYTKLQAEKRLQEMIRSYPGAKLSMHRIRMPFYGVPDPRNLLTKLLTYDTLVEAPNSITHMPDYVRFVMNNLIKIHEHAGSQGGRQVRIYNATNPGSVTHRQIIEMIDEVTGKKHEKKFITPTELDSIVKIPRTNCVLNTDGRAIAIPVETALRRAIESYFKV